MPKPGLVGTNRKVEESAPQNEIPLAVVGIVPCKVTTENGPIQIGDLLVTSSTPSHAMKGTNRSKMLGAVVGKALEKRINWADQTAEESWVTLLMYKTIQPIERNTSAHQRILLLSLRGCCGSDHASE